MGNVQISFEQAKQQLSNYIQGYVQLNYPTANGTLQQQLEFISKHGKTRPQQLNGRVIPEEVELNVYEEYILLQWREIGQSRSISDGIQQSITDSNILDYCRLMEIDLRIVDIQCIKSTDRAFISEIGIQKELNKE